MKPFICQSCNSPAISAPSPVDDLSVVYCNGCNAPISTWGELKQRVAGALDVRRRSISCDPLVTVTGLEPATCRPSNDRSAY
jgi:hypothetical protein